MFAEAIATSLRAAHLELSEVRDAPVQVRDALKRIADAIAWADDLSPPQVGFEIDEHLGKEGPFTEKYVRRLKVIEEFLALDKRTAERADQCAEKLGIKRRRFYVLVAGHKAGTLSRDGKSRPRKVSVPLLHLLGRALAEPACEIPLSEIVRRMQTYTSKEGTEVPSFDTLRRFILKNRHRVTLVKPEIPNALAKPLRDYVAFGAEVGGTCLGLAMSTDHRNPDTALMGLFHKSQELASATSEALLAGGDRT